jgi:hypothetical protein
VKAGLTASGPFCFREKRKTPPKRLEILLWTLVAQLSGAWASRETSYGQIIRTH